MGAEADFGGWATKADLECTDGLTIMKDAFAHQDGKKVPLVWSHKHDDVEHVLGHAILTQKDGSTYADAFFNKTQKGIAAKLMLEHGDLDSLSIWANQLVKKGKSVFHGAIREVSLVLAGANPGAKIDFVNIAHGDYVDDLDNEVAVITMGLPIEFKHSTEETGHVGTDDEAVHADDKGDVKSAQDVYDSMTDDQKELLHQSVAAALEGGTDDEAAQSAADDSTDSIAHQEGTEEMTSTTRSIFENHGDDTALVHSEHIAHADFADLVNEARDSDVKLSAVVRRFVKSQGGELKHGITNMELLFPDAKSVDSSPQLLKRRTEWVAGVLGNVSKRPFSRIKTLYADITEDEARARGHIKGHQKIEEFFKFAKRVTTATMVYKLQALDREDVLEITDFDVVVFMKGEMRLMLDEELARAILIGDGRPTDDESHIKDPGGDVAEGAGIRAIINDHELYAPKLYVNIKDANSKPSEITDAIIKGLGAYKGSGSPTFYTTRARATSMLLERDNDGRRLYRNRAELADELGVAAIVDVEVMEGVANLVGIIVNLTDYVVGTNRGGEVTLFDDFDIDFNKNKWLIETFLSGALNVLKSAVVVWERASGSDVLVSPAKPAFVAATGALTIVNQTGVVYKHGATTINAAGSPYTVPAGEEWIVDAIPAAGYFFEDSEHDQWLFQADEA